MRGKTIIIVGVLALVFGFFTGQAVNADAPAPGSEADPLVSKSFMDTSLQNKVVEMQGTIDSLNSKIKELNEQVTNLTAKLNLVTGEKVELPTDNNQNNNNQPPQPAKQIAYIKDTNTFVNVRTGPGTNYDIVAKVYKNQPMEVLKKEGQWYQVKLENGTIAWVADWVVVIK